MMFQGRSMSGSERNCAFLNTLANPAVGARLKLIDGNG